MNLLKGKVAVITGGASGIGLVTAQMFAREGAKIVIGDVQDAPQAIRDIGAVFVRTDVRDPRQVDALVAKAVGEHGRLDVMFNNAGIEFHGPFAATEPGDHERMVDINLNGVYYCMQAAIRAMLANKGPARGSIVNTASVAGLTGCPGLSTYNATKAAVVMLTKNAALEYGPFGIRVNAVCPGIIRTPMALASVGEMGPGYLEGIGRKAHPLGRIGEPEEVATLVRFLASEESSFITGAAIPIDGGMTAGFSTAPGWDPSDS